MSVRSLFRDTSSPAEMRHFFARFDADPNSDRGCEVEKVTGREPSASGSTPQAVLITNNLWRGGGGVEIVLLNLLN